MGAYLFYMLERKSQADKYNRFIVETDEGKRLIKAEALLTVSGNDDINWAKENNPHFIRYHRDNFGKGEFKASGIPDREIINAGCKSEKEYFELITNLFVKAQLTPNALRIAIIPSAAVSLITLYCSLNA